MVGGRGDIRNKKVGGRTFAIICDEKPAASVLLIISLKTYEAIKYSKVMNQYTTLKDNSNCFFLKNHTVCQFSVFLLPFAFNH